MSIRSMGWLEEQQAGPAPVPCRAEAQHGVLPGLETRRESAIPSQTVRQWRL